MAEVKKVKEQKDKLAYSMEIPRQSKYVVLVREFLERVLKMENIISGERDDMILAVSEACDKLMTAEVKGVSKMKVLMNVKISAKKVTVKLVNKQKKPEHEEFSDVDEHQIVLETIRNRIGDYLIKKTIDEINFSSSRKKGSSIKIIKYRGKK